MSETWWHFGQYTDDAGNAVPVGMPFADTTTHLNVLGTTGSGKSTFLANLCIQAFMSGLTVVVIEPHGDLILHEAEGIIPRLPFSMLNRTVVLDLASDWPFQINMFRTSRQLGGLDMAVATAMGSIRAAEEAGWETSIAMREKLEHGFRLMIDAYGAQSSMLMLLRFLSDNGFRGKTIEKAGDMVLESKIFWEPMHAQLVALAQKGKTDRSMDVPLRRVGRFVRDKRLLYSMGLPDLGRAVNIEPVINANQPRMLLVPLQESKLGADVKAIFGSLFMQMVASSFMGRTGSAARRQVLVVIDEFPDMAGGDIGEIVKMLLAQARKFGAAVCLASQFVAQLPTRVKAEVRGNTNIKVFLLTQGKDDAKEAAETLGAGLTLEDIQGIERFHGYAKVMIGKRPQPPFYFKALAPITPREALRFGDPPKPVQLHPALSDLHIMADTHFEQAVQYLQNLSTSQFARAVNMQQQYGLYMANSMAASPSWKPDKILGKHIYYEQDTGSEKVRRALAINNARDGVPKFILEAHYRRSRFD
jgi:hypothetical protein